MNTDRSRCSHQSLLRCAGFAVFILLYLPNFGPHIFFSTIDILIKLISSFVDLFAKYTYLLKYTKLHPFCSIKRPYNTKAYALQKILTTPSRYQITTSIMMYFHKMTQCAARRSRSSHNAMLNGLRRRQPRRLFGPWVTYTYPHHCSFRIVLKSERAFVHA